MQLTPKLVLLTLALAYAGTTVSALPAGKDRGKEPLAFSSEQLGLKGMYAHRMTTKIPEEGYFQNYFPRTDGPSKAEINAFKSSASVQQIDDIIEKLSHPYYSAAVAHQNWIQLATNDDLRQQVLQNPFHPLHSTAQGMQTKKFVDKLHKAIAAAPEETHPPAWVDPFTPPSRTDPSSSKV